MQFEISTNLSTAIPSVIDFNYNELKAELTERMQHYNNLVITEDTIKEGKADKAKLNKLREAIESERKRIKKIVMQPYTDFEVKCKELVVLIDNPIAAIDGQLKAYDEQRKEAKNEEIQQAYDTMVDEYMKTIIPLDRIFDPRWLNVSTSMKAIQEAIDLTVKKTRTNLQVIDMVPECYRTAVLTKYIETLEIGTALEYQKQLQAAEKAAKPEPAAEVEQTTLTPEKKPKWANPEPAPEPAAEPDEKLYRLRLEFSLTIAQADQLKQFLADARIAYKKI